MKRFGLLGAAGYIAPRHLLAIKDTQNELVVAMDISDSVGIMDTHFPKAEFFTAFEEFEEFVEDERLAGRNLDYITICSPNYLHASHIKYALRNKINVICEKPLVLNSSELNSLKIYENTYGAKVNTILQLRLHPAILQLREKVQSSNHGKVFDVELTYITSRGKWYMRSWKGVEEKSGGVATNIGVHFYDMLHFIFGPVLKNEVHYRDQKTAAGYIEYKKARVRWFLSIDASLLPEKVIGRGKYTYRSINVGGEELEFSGGFTDLHTQSYEHILAGNGYGISENMAAIKTVETIRSAKEVINPAERHSLLSEVIR